MKISLTDEEMLSVWRLCRAIEPARADCTVTRTDGIDLDSLLRIEMRAWYLTKLDTAEPHLLATADIAATSTLLPMADGSAVILLPDNCRRVTEVKLGGWDRPATLLDSADPSHREIIAAQASPYVRAGCSAPVAIREQGRLRLWPKPATPMHPAIERLVIIREPDEGRYEMDERLLGELVPQYF